MEQKTYYYCNTCNTMTQDEKWMEKYNEVIDFIKRNHRNPSKYDAEERGRFCTWLKHNRKLMNAGTMREDRMEKFRKLQETMEMYRRKNQYK